MGDIEYDAAEAARYIELHPDARFVLAEDYADLEAERNRLKNNLAVSRKQADEFLAIIDLDPDTQQSRAERAEAERDELQRRLEEVVATLDPGEMPKRTFFDFHETYMRHYSQWKLKSELHTNVRAIAEGRTE